MSRVYNKDDLAKHLAMIEVVGVFGFALGPIFPVLFSNVNTTILGFPISKYNLTTLLLALFSIVIAIACYFGLDNLTMDPAMLRQMNLNNEEKRRRTFERNIKILSTFDIFQSFELTLLLAAQGITAFLYH